MVPVLCQGRFRLLLLKLFFYLIKHCWTLFLVSHVRTFKFCSAQFLSSKKKTRKNWIERFHIAVRKAILTLRLLGKHCWYSKFEFQQSIFQNFMIFFWICWKFEPSDSTVGWCHIFVRYSLIADQVLGTNNTYFKKIKDPALKEMFKCNAIR